jgi:4-hydroxy 2-oxovalerate aldolase
MYRPEIRVLDCSIRDGGLINNWKFTDELVRATYRAMAEAGVDYVEVGYKASKDLFDPKEFGKWRFCEEEPVKRALDGIDARVKLACMVDIGRVRDEDILPASESIFDLIRVACYAKDIDKAIALSDMVMDKGYESSINIMAVSTSIEKDVDEALGELAATRVPYVYVVDSFGNMFSEDIDFLVEKYKAALPGKTIGIHTHNNRQLGFANTVQAVIDGCNILDASAFGIGRGPGNCPIELLLTFLKNPKFDVRPVLKLIQEQYLPLSREIEWGYIIPYMITGVLNEHPRTAIAYRDSPERDDYVKFWDILTTPETRKIP